MIFQFAVSPVGFCMTYNQEFSLVHKFSDAMEFIDAYINF